MATEREPVCLSCGESEVTPIAQHLRIETDSRNSKLLGIAHPICGKQLRIVGSEPNRIRMALVTREFDTLGKKLSERYSAGKR